jgi:hypothetical protein
MKPLKSEIKQNALIALETMCEGLFQTLHKHYQTISGDISPTQQFRLEELQEELSSLIADQVFQNLDFSKFDLQSLTREELIELAYSIDWNGSWDSDEEGQEPISKEELIKSITAMIEESLA